MQSTEFCPVSNIILQKCKKNNTHLPFRTYMHKYTSDDGCNAADWVTLQTLTSLHWIHCCPDSATV